MPYYITHWVIMSRVFPKVFSKNPKKKKAPEGAWLLLFRNQISIFNAVPTAGRRHSGDMAETCIIAFRGRHLPATLAWP
jgi:hypothetical protein